MTRLARDEDDFSLFLLRKSDGYEENRDDKKTGFHE